MKIAIIGSGISGLTAAYILSRKNDITVFEKNDYIGGHTHTHEIEEEGTTVSVDSGFIVYNERTYPNFINILNKLGVQSQLTRMGFSVKSEKDNLEYAGHSLDGLFAQRSNLMRPSFLKILYGMARFNSRARKDLPYLIPEVTLGEYLHSNNYSKEFIANYIIPIGAAIWSTAPDDMLEISAIFFIRFFDNHGLLQVIDRPNWWVIKGGSKKYIEKMILGFKDSIKISSPVHKVKRSAGKVEIIFGKHLNSSDVFDKVIFSNHSDQALRVLENPTDQENEILGSIKYQTNEAILHNDYSILPNRRRAWSSWNYLLDREGKKPVSLTYNMNILQSLKSSRTYCVSLNSKDLIDSNKIIKNLKYEHPLFTVSTMDAQKRKNEISGKNNTFYCGAYWRNGFHEDGVVSALDVCKSFGEIL